MSKNIYYVRFVTKSQAHRVRDRQSLHRPEHNKEKIKEYNKKRVLCTCGLEISLGNKSGHKKSIKHLLILNL